MKKLSLIIALILTLSLLLCSAASADVITALATEINPEHLEKTASYARILGYNEETNTLTVELIIPEVFAAEEVEALQVGDSIFTEGREVLIETMEVTSWGTYMINDQGNASHPAVFLLKGLDGNYRTDHENDHGWNTIAVIECPVTDSLLCLNFIDDQTGETLELPRILTAHELTSQIFAEQAAETYFATWASDKVYVVFDGEGKLAMIDRYVIPWYPFSFENL